MHPKNHKFSKTTLSIAVLIALQSMNALAESTTNEIKTTPKKQEEIENKPAEKELAEVTVKATSIQSSDGYQATKTRVGKTLQDPHDIPQAVTTVTGALIKDQQLSSLREALSNVAGLTFNAAEGGRAGDNMMLRGFYTFGDIYLDGIRDTAQYNRELFNLKQVDVLRGSAAMLFGRGQAGGVINQVTKMAELKDENKVSASLGSYNYYSATGDFNKKLGETTAIRVNVMDRAEENYRKNPANGDRPRLDRQGIALSFGTGIGTDDEFFLNHVTTKTEDKPDFGVSFYNNRPVNRIIGGQAINDKTYYGGDRNFDNSNTSITTGIYTHKFSNDSQIRTQLRSADYERAYWAQKPSASVLPTENFSTTGAVTRKMHYQTQTLQSDFSTKFNLAGMKHEFLTGVEYLREKNYRNSLLDLDGSSGLLYKENVESTNTPSKFDADNYAVYLQDTIEFIPKWNFLFGVRRDELRADYSSATSNNNQTPYKRSLSFGENSYRTAISWHQTPENHYYLSYSDSFSPTADLYQLTTRPQPAERSKTAELGAKWLFFGGDLAFRSALYRTEKEWERNTDLEATASILTKRRRTDGIEFEVAGRITSKWEVFGGLALMDAEILEVAENISNNGTITVADSSYKGKRPRNTPPVTFNVWSTYKLDEHWKVGAGLEAKAERLGYVPSSASAYNPNVLPGYARLDAMVSYEEKKWAVKLNVKNVLDKVYYDAIYDNGGFSVPGNSRTVILTTEIKF